MAIEPINPFILSKIYPDATSILKSNSKSEESYKDYLFVLDTNTLLAPYSIGKESMEKIKSIYSDLISKNTLYIPKHSIREFARVRSFKISEIFTSIDNALSNVPALPKLDYPILYNLDSHKSLQEFKESFKAVTKQYKELIEALHENVLNWDWQDPVTKIYSDIFKDNIFITSTDTEEELLKEVQFRYENNIPPGFKDRGKPDNSIGDLLIWKSILTLGKDKSRNIAFVTNEEKADWYVVGNKKPIVTRFELVNEYYRETGGRSFACMSFSSFLALQGAASEVVGEVQVASERIQAPIIESRQIESTSLNLLNIISSEIRIFLLGNSRSDNYFLDADFNHKVKIYRESWSSDFVMRYIPYSILMEIDTLLNDITHLSDLVEYAWHRQKRDTIPQQLKIQSLCSHFINLYDSLNLSPLIAL